MEATYFLFSLHWPTLSFRIFRFSNVAKSDLKFDTHCLVRCVQHVVSQRHTLPWSAAQHEQTLSLYG